MQATFQYLMGRELTCEPRGRDSFFQRRFDYASNLYSKDLRAHYSCVNAVEFSNSCELMASGGDDKRVLIWNADRHVLSGSGEWAGAPAVLNTRHHSNIFTLAWDNEDRKLFSGGNDHQLIVHDVETRHICDVFLHENAVLCVCVQPQASHVFATACESGQLSLYDLRLSNSDPIILASSAPASVSRGYSDALWMSSDSSSSSNSSSESLRSTGGAFQSCQFSPVDCNLLAAANEISGVSLIDLRMKRTLLRYRAQRGPSKHSESVDTGTNQNAMSVRFCQSGQRLAVLRGKLRPAVYCLNEPAGPACLFDHEGFANACTLKSCCFAGQDDQYFVTGSDDFAVYCWKIPWLREGAEAEAQLVSAAHLRLQGHRSIVNQCRFNRKLHLLATSGVEKVVKVWSPYQLPGGNSYGGLSGRREELPPKRKMYTLNELLRQPNGAEPADGADSLAPSVMLNRANSDALLDESLEEDRLMIAFFDSQVRRHRRLEDMSSETATSPTARTPKKKRKLRRLTSTISNPSDLSDLEAEAGPSAVPRVELSLTDGENTDTENNQGDNELDSHSSRSESSDDASSVESDEDASVQATRFNKKRQGKCRGSLAQKQRASMPLRDRLRSLRHRRTLNITEQPDYKNVLDCLRVVGPHTEAEGTASDMDAPSRFFNNKKSATVGLKASADARSSPEDSAAGHGAAGHGAAGHSAESSFPGTSRSFTNKRLKSLNEQKRKIELNRDTADNEDNADNADNGQSLDTESQANSGVERVVFKKLRRRATKQTKQDEAESEALESRPSD